MSNLHSVLATVHAIFSQELRSRNTTPDTNGTRKMLLVKIDPHYASLGESMMALKPPSKLGPYPQSLQSKGLLNY